MKYIKNTIQYMGLNNNTIELLNHSTITLTSIFDSKEKYDFIVCDINISNKNLQKSLTQILNQPNATTHICFTDTID